MLTRQQILEANDLPREEVQTPEWGGSVFVRTMNGKERDAFEVRHRQDGDKNWRARFAATIICDEKGAPLFTEADVEALGEKSWAVLDRIFDAGTELSKVSSAAIEALRGNSNATHSDDSASASLTDGDAASENSSPESAQTS